MEKLTAFSGILDIVCRLGGRADPQFKKSRILHVHLERLTSKKDDGHIRSPAKPSRHRRRDMIQINRNYAP